MEQIQKTGAEAWPLSLSPGPAAGGRLAARRNLPPDGGAEGGLASPAALAQTQASMIPFNEAAQHLQMTPQASEAATEG